MNNDLKRIAQNFIDSNDITGHSNRHMEKISENENSFQVVRDFLAQAHYTNFHHRLLDLLRISVLDSVERELSPEEYSNFAVIFQRAFAETSPKYIGLATKPAAYEAHEAHMIDAIRSVQIDGYYLEFGVYKGGTINLMARSCPHQIFHGFDSFYGLPEKWGSHEVGYLTLDGIPPDVAANVTLQMGHFDQSLPKFLEENPEKVAFVHIDCDLYSSTLTVLTFLKERFQHGTVIVFDEYMADEYRAFEEFLRYSVFSFKYLSYHFGGGSVAVMLELH